MPLDPKLTKFTTASPLQVSFSYSDIAAATSYNTFSLLGTTTSSGEDYLLTLQTEDANPAYISTIRLGSSEGSFTQDTDDDFDLTQQEISQSLRGTGLINIHYVYKTDNGTTAADWYVVVKVRKWDGSTETEVASVQSETITDRTTVGKTGIFSMPITVPETIYAVGDTIRVTVEIWTKFSGGANQLSIAYGISPSGQAATYSSITFDNTNSIIKLPYKLDL